MLRPVKLVFSVLSALLLTLSFPGCGAWYLAWIALIPLLAAIDGEKPGRAFLLSYITGALFFLGTIWWLAHVTFLGMLILVLYLALYVGLFGLLVSLVTGRHKALSVASSVLLVFFIPALWVNCEWLRANLFTGFGWAILGYSQSPALLPIQIADITGVYGVSFVVVFVNAAIFFAVKAVREKRSPHTLILTGMLILFLVLYYGKMRVNNFFMGDPVKVGVVQGNIPQDRKWDWRFRQYILEKYLRLTRGLNAQDPDIIVWPETSVPGFLEGEEALLGPVAALAKELKKPLLVGTLREDAKDDRVYYNSATLITDEGRVTASYDKVHLVPFGEYVPLKKVFSFVEKIAPAPIGDVTRGKECTVFALITKRTMESSGSVTRVTKKLRFAAFICFEDVFPELSRTFVKAGARFLVNMTNDAWYKRTPAAAQHLQCSVLRAVENRINVVRATNTGISCAIDQRGKVIGMIEDAGNPLFVDGARSFEIIVVPTRTFYTVFGDLFTSLCMIFGLIVLTMKK